MPAEPAARLLRKYLRFSVRGLLVLVLVIAAALGWLVRGARTQRHAVAAIERAGGSVGYHSGWTHSPFPDAQEWWAPKWLVDAIGIDYFDLVDSVGFYGSGHLYR